MALGIRRVSQTKDRAEMVDILNRNFGPIQERRFDWRHTLNTAGEAFSWFMYDQASKNTVAMATVFPRFMRVNGKLTRGGQVGEFAVDSKYRSLGPAVQLQRATFEPVDDGNVDFSYDCPPHGQGMSTFIRLGMAPNCEVFRYALLFRTDEYFASRLATGLWIKPLVAVGNLALRMRTAKPHPPDVEICEHIGAFGEEFTCLDENAGVAGAVRSSRIARVLNWRYVEDPMASLCSSKGEAGKYQVLVARRRGELKAFLVFFIQSDGIAELVDLFGVDIPTVGFALLDAAIAVCRREKVSALHGFCSGDSELKPLFEALGFRRRERNAHVVAYVKPGNSTFAQMNSHARWTFSQVEVML